MAYQKCFQGPQAFFYEVLFSLKLYFLKPSHPAPTITAKFFRTVLWQNNFGQLLVFILKKTTCAKLNKTDKTKKGFFNVWEKLHL